ncbi:MAG: asparagine synthase-related protein, partial [Emergencia timonensis]
MELRTFFREHPKVALGFSGGVDSSYLLYAAREYGAEIGAYFIKSQFQPDFELADAKRLAEQVGTELRILKCDILAEQSVRENPQDRCYYCKNRIFGLLAEAAKVDGYEVIIDGTNLSDEAADRPGMK